MEVRSCGSEKYLTIGWIVSGLDATVKIVFRRKFHAVPAAPEPEEDVFASFVVFEVQFANEQPIFWGVGTEDPTGNITLEDNTRIVLEPGYYYIAYSVSAVLDNAGYMQITPFYNGAAHLEYGIYFKTGIASSSACGSGFMIISVPSRTNFTLNYNSSVGNRSGAASITFLKLNRES